MPKSTKLTYRECAKGLKKLLKHADHYGHKRELTTAILELEKLARAEESERKLERQAERVSYICAIEKNQ